MSTPVRRLLIDITHSVSHDYNTGIQRVVRCLAREAVAFTESGQSDVECIPVIYRDGQYIHADAACAARGYRKSSRDWACEFQKLIPSSISTSQRLTLLKLGTRIRKLLYPRSLDRGIRKLIRSWQSPDIPVQPTAGDVLLMPDSWWDLPEIFDAIEPLRQDGVLVAAMIHDIIPIRHPEFFGEGVRVKFTRWLKRLVESVDMILGDAEAIENDLWAYIQERNAPIARECVKHVRLGCDIAPSKRAAESRVPAQLRGIFSDRDKAPYLMVSTIEIRKNHHYLIDAFEQLWQDGTDSSLAIVGRIGWQCDDVIERIANHPESGKRLHVFNNIDDNTLNYVYQNSKAFLFSSKAEGFGLPIVEAQHHGLHVFASDIPIFREVAGSGAQFFSLNDPSELKKQIQQFEAEQGWQSEPSVTVINQPWKEVFPKLVRVVEQLAANCQKQGSGSSRSAA